MIGIPTIMTASNSGVDSDAQAFLTAAAITDSTQRDAINTLVKNLKLYSLWTKIYALYPMVGGSATTHKWNLKDPRDLDAAFRLVFSGTWSHTASGADPNGTTAYANTFLVPSSVLSLNSVAIMYYSTDNNTAAGVDMSCRGLVASPSDPCLLELAIKWTDNFMYWGLHNSEVTGITVTDTRGLFTLSRTSSTAVATYQNGSRVSSGSVASTSRPEFALYIGAENEGGTINDYGNRNCAGAAVTDGLTENEMTDFYYCWQTFQTKLGRQV